MILINFIVSFVLVPVVKKQMAPILVSTIENKIDENPPLYPSPVLDSDGRLIGSPDQDRVVGSPATCLVEGIEYTHGQQVSQNQTDQFYSYI